MVRLEQVSARLPARWLGLGLTLMTASSCFEVHEVDTGTPITWRAARTVDDFESENRFPTWSLLDAWRCSAYPGSSTCTEEHSEDQGRGRVGLLSFDVTSQAVGDYAGVVFSASRAAASLDLARYDQLAFSTRISPSSAESLPPDAWLRVRFECPSAAVVGERGEERVSIQSAVTAVADGAWHDFSIDLGAFLQPEFQDWERIDAQRCRSRVDTIGFELTADSLGKTPGRHMAGTVEFDDIELRALQAPETIRHWAWRNIRRGRASLRPSAATRPRHAAPLRRVSSVSTRRMSFDDDYQGEEEPWKALCSVPITTNSLSHESISLAENLTRFQSFSFTAQFTPGELAPEAPGRFTVRLGTPQPHVLGQHPLGNRRWPRGERRVAPAAGWRRRVERITVRHER